MTVPTTVTNKSTVAGSIVVRRSYLFGSRTNGVKTLRTQDTSDPRHFGTIKLVPKCPDSSAPVECRRSLTMRILSVCLSVCLHFAKRKKNLSRFYTAQKIIHPSFLRRRMVGGGDPGLGLPTVNFSIPRHRRTIEGPKAPKEARQVRNAGALRG